MKPAIPCEALALIVAFALGACAGGTARTDTLAAQFAQADARRAAQLAPDLFARAQRAQAQARSSGDAAAREDHAARAQLLLAAALAEADRIDDERAADQADERAERAAAARAALERERQAVEQQIATQAAARSARAEAALAFADAAPAEAVPQRARLLRERARLILAAARALGLPEAQADKVEQRIVQAEHGGAGASAITAAQSALSAAERALGQARAARAPNAELASAEECAALIEMARERGFAPAPGARGVVLPLTEAFTSGAAQPTSRGQRLLRQLAALASAHPLGAIQIEAQAEPARASVGRARADRIAASLRETREPALLSRATSSADADRLGAPLVVFTAYRAAAAR